MNKLTFMKRAFALVAIASAIAFVFVGIFSPIEPGMSVFGHVMKTVTGWLGVTVILETITFSAGQFIYHWAKDAKETYGKGWFWTSIKNGLKNIWKSVSWRKVIISYIIFFIVAFLLIQGVEFIWSLF